MARQRAQNFQAFFFAVSLIFVRVDCLSPGSCMRVQSGIRLPFFGFSMVHPVKTLGYSVTSF